MVDRFGPRGVLALMVPLQNANMQPEYEAMRPEGINNQIYRFTMADPDHVPEAMISAIPGTIGCWADLVVCGNSIEMRNWSVERQKWYRQAVQAALPCTPVITATDATEAALRTVGARKIVAMSPMSETYSKSVAGYYSSLGFDVLRHGWLEAPRPQDIIRVPVDQIHDVFERLDSRDVDCFLHVGGALGIVDQIDELEDRLGRPVISVNAAAYWYALRQIGVEDALDRGGRVTRMALPAEFNRRIQA